LSLRPSTVKHIEHDLRQFGTWLADTHPEVANCAELHREHIEAFKKWLSIHPTAATGKPLNRVSIKNALINLHCFLTRITEWGYPNAPVRPLMFPGDLPIVDKPLPRFLDDAAASKLMRAARADSDPLSRLIVELLARTGIRRGELLALTVDAVVQIGSAYWLRIPIGKLHNDRYIPLHPQLKELLDEWITHHRPSGLRTNRLLLEHNRPISDHRITKALRHLADIAGIGTVTAHQLRHTLATQAINRGMSLDAIAALLGHKTLAMTMIYARIADRTVADEYFAVTEKVEALYDQPRRRGRRRNAQTPQRDAPAHARQRLLRPTRRDGLPLRIHLRIVQLLRHHHRVPPHPAVATRRRRLQGSTRTSEDLRRHPRPPRHRRVLTRSLDRITRISPTTPRNGSTKRSAGAPTWSGSFPTATP
jgi:integrase/recombinase XerD